MGDLLLRGEGGVFTLFWIKAALKTEQILVVIFETLWPPSGLKQIVKRKLFGVGAHG